MKYLVKARSIYNYKVLQAMYFDEYANAEYIANKWRLYYGESAYITINEA